MARTDLQIRGRVPARIKAWLDEGAAESGRSLSLHLMVQLERLKAMEDLMTKMNWEKARYSLGKAVDEEAALARVASRPCASPKVSHTRTGGTKTTKQLQREENSRLAREALAGGMKPKRQARRKPARNSDKLPIDMAAIDALASAVEEL